MRNALVIAGVNLMRLARDPSTFFFVLVLPLLLIVVVGSTAAGSRPVVAIVAPDDGDSLTSALVADLTDVEAARTAVVDADTAQAQLRRGDVAAVVVVPDNLEATVAAGGQARIGFVSTPAGGGFRIRSVVDAVVADVNARLGAEQLLVNAGVPDSQAAGIVAGAAQAVPGIGVDVVDPGGEAFVEVDNFSLVASQQLVLFMFLNSMMAAAALIQARRLGVIRRMSASPASTAEILSGQALGRFGVVLFQSLFIVGATAALFGVDWGSWPATGALVVLFAVVSTAAALLIGALVANENQSTAIGLALGLALAALGGCMVPLEVFPPTLATLAHFTPHAWAVEGLGTVVAEGGGLASVGTELAVLALYGVGLLTLGGVALRRAIVA